MRRRAIHPTVLALLACLLGLLCCPRPGRADNLSEYRLKAAFLYNFVAFTEWPAGVGSPINLCVYGPDPFGEELDKLQAKSAAGRGLLARRTNSVSGLADCQVVFITQPMIDNLPRVLDQLSGKPVLTVSDTPGAARQGVAINMVTEMGKVTFKVNLGAVRGNGLELSSKLLRLAKEVIQ